MASVIEFGSRDVANEVREEHGEHLTGRFDRRHKSVELESDAPDSVRDDVTTAAAESRADKGGPGQVALTDEERRKIDFSKEGNNVPKARSVKAIALDEGVSNWLDYYDRKLSVDEHREVYERAEGDVRLDEETEQDIDERTARAGNRAEAEGCDHARGHCKHGDPEACEFLGEECGYSEAEIDRLIGEGEPPVDDGFEGESDHAEEIPPRVQGSLSQAWTGYYAGIADAERYAAIINKIRAEYGQEPIAFKKLNGRKITKEDVDT